MFESREEGNQIVKDAAADLKARQTDLAEHLRDCSDNLARRMLAIDDRMEDGDDKLKSSLGDLKRRLAKQKTRVDRSLKEIEGSTSDSWEKVSKKSNSVLTEAKIEAQKIEERVEDLID